MRFLAESIIHATPENVFAFHELPDALERLTPPWAGSRVIARAASLEVGARSLFDIRVAPLVWIFSEMVHTEYDPPHRFVDEQARGPFAKWIHRHEVHRAKEGARLVDDIEFEAPLGFAGRAFAPLLITPRLRRLFAYRHEVTRAWCEGATTSLSSGRTASKG